MNECEFCGCNRLEFIGALGNMAHYRCRNCGMLSYEEMASDAVEADANDDFLYKRQARSKKAYGARGERIAR